MSRIERVSKLIKEEISEIIRQEVSDPRIGFVSITGVDLSADLEEAKIFVSIFGDEKRKQEGMQGLQSATKYIRGKLGHMLELRTVPEIRFVRDDSLEKGSRILGIMSQLRKASRQAPGPEQGRGDRGKQERE